MVVNTYNPSLSGGQDRRRFDDNQAKVQDSSVNKLKATGLGHGSSGRALGGPVPTKTEKERNTCLLLTTFYLVLLSLTNLPSWAPSYLFATP
jgi:hypothetical protein